MGGDLGRDVLKSSLNMLSLFELRCHREEHSSKGRSDLTVECDNSKFVFELKVVTDRKDADAALQAAKKQITDKDYAKGISTLKVVPVAAVIVNETKVNEANTPSVLREIVYLEGVDLNQDPQVSQ